MPQKTVCGTRVHKKRLPPRENIVTRPTPRSLVKFAGERKGEIFRHNNLGGREVVKWEARIRRRQPWESRQVGEGGEIPFVPRPGRGYPDDK